MYKVLFDNVVIDILESIRYARYLKKSKHTVVTDRSSANCIIASNNVDKYHLSSLPYPEGCNIKTVTIAPIDDDEYRLLTAELKKAETVVDIGLRYLKQNKIKEMSDTCHQKITQGTRVLLNDNQFHHFELSVEDQLNLQDIRYELDMGADTITYHETGLMCQEYSAADMRTIIDTLYKHKQKHIQYFNQLKRAINSKESIDDVINVRYEL